MKPNMRVLLTILYSSIETAFYTQVENLLGAKHFTISTISHSAYIPPIVHLWPDMM
jgi:hypothetical protein